MKRLTLKLIALIALIAMNDDTVYAGHSLEPFDSQEQATLKSRLPHLFDEDEVVAAEIAEASDAELEQAGQATLSGSQEPLSEPSDEYSAHARPSIVRDLSTAQPQLDRPRPKGLMWRIREFLDAERRNPPTFFTKISRGSQRHRVLIPLLVEAIATNNFEAAKLILEQRLNLNLTNQNTPLQAAFANAVKIENGKIVALGDDDARSIIHLLVNARADMRQIDPLINAYLDKKGNPYQERFASPEVAQEFTTFINQLRATAAEPLAPEWHF